MADEDTAAPVPPYSSFTTVRHLIERMEQQGVPSRIDNTYLVGMAGGTQAQVKHALRSLGLINEDGTVTTRLIDLVKRPDDRPRLLGHLLRERYPRLTDLDQSATRGQLDESLKSYGLNGATARKAASFFIAAATYAQLPLSPYFPAVRSGSGGPGATRTKRNPGKRKQPAAGDTTDAQDSLGTDYSTRVKVGNAGTVMLTVNINPIKLSQPDRNFFFELVDRMKEYEATQTPPPGNGGAADNSATEERVS
ncbi:MAG: DUF5343 domain-containing protein [Gemmatimonadota bacterium]|nr:DUF5343 domain-containing protein [Gemmatimonadota bacterium]